MTHSKFNSLTLSLSMSVILATLGQANVSHAQTAAAPKTPDKKMKCSDERALELIKKLAPGNPGFQATLKTFDQECLGKAPSPQEEAMEEAEANLNGTVARGVDLAMGDLQQALVSFNQDTAKQRACTEQITINQRQTRAGDPFFGTMLGSIALSMCGILNGSVSLTDDAQGAFFNPQASNSPMPMMMRADQSRPMAAKSYGQVFNGPYKSFADIRYLSTLLIMREFAWESYGLLKAHGVRNLKIQIKRSAAAGISIQGDTAVLQLGYDLQEMPRGSVVECLTCTSLPQLRGNLTRKSIIQYREFDPNTEIKPYGELPLTKYKPGASSAQLNEQGEVISLSVLTADHYTTPSRDPNISNKMLLVDYPRPAELESSIQRSGLRPSGPVYNSPQLREANVMRGLEADLQRKKAEFDAMMAKFQTTGSPFAKSAGSADAQRPNPQDRN